MFDELDRAANAGDVEKAGRVFGDLKERYPRTAFAQQAGMLAAKLQFEKGKSDDARASLAWVIEHAVEDEYRSRRAPAPGRRCCSMPSSTTKR